MGPSTCQAAAGALPRSASPLYECKFARCVHWFRTPGELSEHYVERHRAVLSETDAHLDD